VIDPEKLENCIRTSSNLLSENSEVITTATKMMPKYVYYSNYGNLDSDLYLPRVIEDLNREDLNEKAQAKVRTIRTLFEFVNLDPKEILSLGDQGSRTANSDEIEKHTAQKAEREVLLDSASTSFTKNFNDWWKQGKYKFDFQADGDYFKIWVSDEVRTEKIELEARSTGLQWFFSFYLIFLVESLHEHRNAILLLDEPGVTLHPNAQKDLFEFFEGLAEKNQIFYTTHSPFMVDADHLERVRSVYVDKSGYTVVSSDLRASEREKGLNQSQSIYPAHAALGLTVSDTLLINCIPVLVEGISDQFYLSALKNLLISKGKIQPLKEIAFIPTGGVKAIKATTGIIQGKNEDLPYVIIDGDNPGQKIKKDLIQSFYSNEADRVIDISEYTGVKNGEIEDIFPADKFAQFVSRFLPRPEEVEDEFEDFYIDGVPMCNQIEEYAKKNQISLDTGWKVNLAKKIKSEILKGKDRVISEEDPTFGNIVKLFQKFCQ